MQGFGHYQWPNSRSYKGDWVRNSMDGEGIMEWPEDQRIYKGAFKNDIIHGRGQMFWPDGRCYDGEWQNGKQHGVG